MKLKFKYFGKIHATLVILSLVFLARIGSAETWFTNEVWISPIAQTNGGNGTLDYPYDGSTQAKFDAVMGSLLANTTIHLLSGTYQTWGSSTSGGYLLKSGQTVFGSGIGNTILQLAPNAPGNGTFVDVIASVDSFCSNNIVSDVTLDCNFNAQTIIANGVVLYGSHQAVRNVKVINSGTPGNEAFGIVVNGGGWGNTNASGGNFIEGCEVSGFAGGHNISAIVFSSDTQISGIIRNNRVFLAPDLIGGQIAINGANLNNVLIEGNYVNGARNGFYDDSGGNANVIVVHNTFKNCLDEVFVRNVVGQNLTFAFNTFMLATNTAYSPSVFQFYANASYTNITICGNNVQLNNKPAGLSYFVIANNVTGLMINNNTVDSALTNQFIGCTLTSVYNNYDLYGNFLTNLNQVASPNGVTRKTVTYTGTTIYTNYASYADKYIGVKGVSVTNGTIHAVSIVLPSAVGHAGKDFIVADETGSLQGPNIKFIKIETTAPDKINGGTSITNTTPYTAMTIISDGANWFAH